MSTNRKSAAVVLAVVMIFAALAPIGAAMADEGESDDGDLAIDVSGEDEPVVEVTMNDSGVADANVTVETVDENASYDGAGEFQTDDNGTVTLETPNETVTVEITASADNQTETVEEMLEAPSDDEEEATDDDENPFGQLVSQFIGDTDKDDVDGPFGQVVSNFVQEHNPGNAPDHAGEQGPPDHAGSDDGDDNDSDQSPPNHAGPDTDGDDNDSDQGSPDHAGPDGDDEDADDEDADDEGAEDGDE